MEENKDKKEYEMLKKLNKRLTDFSADDKKQVKGKDDSRER